MFGLGKPSRPTAVAFDIIGTVFPLEPMRPAILALGLPAAGLEGWFAAGLRDAFAMSAVGDFKPFTTVLEGALDQVLAEQGLTAPEGEKTALVKQLEQLSARPDALQAFEMLKREGVRIAALTNGSKSSTRSLLEQSGLLDLVERVISVDEVKLSKPRREVYEHAAQTMKVEPGELALLAAHPWDVNGAKAAGLATAYLSAERPFSHAMRTPDVEGATLVEAVQRLLELH